MKEKDWLKLKKYTHLTPKLKEKDKKWVRQYVKEKSKIISHRFYPMLHYSICKNKFRRQKFNGKRSKLRKKSSKTREIFYSNHLDSQVFSYYAHLIRKELEVHYNNDKFLSNSVIAYRRIPFNKERNKCNIDFANEVFSYIKNSNKKRLTAISIDITQYFDSLNHKILKKKWSSLLNRNDLPKDHFKVYRSITNYSFIEVSAVIESSPYTRVQKLSDIRHKNLDSFFSNGREFRKAIKGENIIKVNSSRVGIPQGSPISAVLSNLYLIDFDKLMAKLAKTYNGIYRRYSDDIIFISDPKWIDKVIDTIKIYMFNLDLSIQEKKTQRVDFVRSSKNDAWTALSNANLSNRTKKGTLTYLGFNFDGRKVRIRQKGVSSYYRKMKRLIRRAAYFAKNTKQAKLRGKSGKSDPWIYRTKIYRLKTHLGSRKKSFNGKVYWGNYLSYVYNAAKIMDEPAIRKQLRNHWRITEREIDRFNSKYNLKKSKRNLR